MDCLFSNRSKRVLNRIVILFFSMFPISVILEPFGYGHNPLMNFLVNLFCFCVSLLYLVCVAISVIKVFVVLIVILTRKEKATQQCVKELCASAIPLLPMLLIYMLGGDIYTYIQATLKLGLRCVQLK